jgi:hypothetical protein
MGTKSYILLLSLCIITLIAFCMFIWSLFNVDKVFTGYTYCGNVVSVRQIPGGGLFGPTAKTEITTGKCNIISNIISIVKIGDAVIVENFSNYVSCVFVGDSKSCVDVSNY